MNDLRKGYQDFTIYYTSGLLLRQGKGASLYDQDLQYRTQLTFAQVPDARQALPYNHPPFEALLFVPFTLLGYWNSYLLWDVLNVIMVAASALLLRRLRKIRELPPVILGLACAAFFPIAITMLLGQDLILLLLLMTVALTYLDRGNDAAAGAWLAVGLFRPHMVVPLILLLAVRRWRVLLGFIPTSFLLAGISAIISGWRWPVIYVQYVLQVEQTWGRRLGPEEAPNLRGMLSYLPWVRGSAMLAAALIAASTLVVCAFALRRIRKGNDSGSYLFCLAVVTTILVSFHSLWYDFTLLLPLVLFLLASLMTAKPGELGASRIVLLFLLFLSPLYLYLAIIVHFFCVYGLVAIALFILLLRMPSPAAEPS